jgi:hypothetical protein
MGPDRKPRKWLYYFIPIVSLVLIIGLIFLIPPIRKPVIDWINRLIFGPEQNGENYNPEKDKENAKKVILDFYHAYQELAPKKIISLTEEPLTYWETTHCENLREQDIGYNEPDISLNDLSFDFKNINSNEAEIVVKRLNVLEVTMPFKFGETTQGDMSFELRKGNGWRITNRTYISLWVSRVY